MVKTFISFQGVGLFVSVAVTIMAVVNGEALDLEMFPAMWGLITVGFSLLILVVEGVNRLDDRRPDTGYNPIDPEILKYILEHQPEVKYNPWRVWYQNAGKIVALGLIVMLSAYHVARLTGLPLEVPLYLAGAGIHMFGLVAWDAL